MARQRIAYFYNFQNENPFYWKRWFAFPLHGWLISPIWQYFSFWFIIAHATYEVLSLSQTFVYTVYTCTVYTLDEKQSDKKPPKKTEKYSNTNEQIQCPVLTQHRTSVNFRWLRVNMNYSKRPAYVYLAHVFFLVLFSSLCDNSQTGVYVNYSKANRCKFYGSLWLMRSPAKFYQWFVHRPGLRWHLVLNFKIPIHRKISFLFVWIELWSIAFW